MALRSAGDVRAGGAYVEITGDDTKLNAALGRAQSRMAAFRAAAVKIAAGISLVTGGILYGLNKAIQKLDIQEEAINSLRASLLSTGFAAGMSERELVALAQGLQKVTRYGDETIISAEAMLLTFTKIGKETFPEALETALNMSTKLKTDLKMSIIQVGKALQDPILGATALRRVGVNLNEQQTEQIKTLVKQNRLYEAQRLILDELATEFGGSARFAARGLGGQMEQLKNQIGDLQEKFAELAGPTIGPFIQKMKDAVSSIQEWMARNPQMVQGIAKLIGALTLLSAAVLALSVAWWLANTAALPILIILAIVLAVADAIGLIDTGLGDLVGDLKIFGHSFRQIWEWIKDEFAIGLFGWQLAFQETMKFLETAFVKMTIKLHMAWMKVLHMIGKISDKEYKWAVRWDQSVMKTGVKGIKNKWDDRIKKTNRDIFSLIAHQQEVWSTEWDKKHSGKNRFQQPNIPDFALRLAAGGGPKAFDWSGWKTKVEALGAFGTTSILERLGGLSRQEQVQEQQLQKLEQINDTLIDIRTNTEDKSATFA